MKIRIFIFIPLAVFLFYFSLFVSGIIPLFAEYKMEMRPIYILHFIEDIVFNPINQINAMYSAQNPLLIISMITLFLLYIYLIYKSRPKKYENVGDKYGVQGSSRWAKNSEIFNVPKQITVVKSKAMFGELKKSIDEKEVKK
ncbi:hypothetical protein [Pontibacillus litoralis]|uniref:Uncharacterized protein n=1 Tax=Pontibacillus litoralis JSM 072002 TaxID=1385512 RepID=A0A0A5FWL1_9BACI|nr:hypothetical protein [Pontibacillus litoralis]KGX85176.1 hypothetical protein N784_09780 [Pontibacillus litoralis JSM 072002]